MLLVPSTLGGSLLAKYFAVVERPLPLAAHAQTEHSYIDIKIVDMSCTVINASASTICFSASANTAS